VTVRLVRVFGTPVIRPHHTVEAPDEDRRKYAPSSAARLEGPPATGVPALTVNALGKAVTPPDGGGGGGGAALNSSLSVWLVQPGAVAPGARFDVR